MPDSRNTVNDATDATDAAADDMLAEDLIEEVSIDGMCGVY